ncbi:MAG: BlaI/MecI/CopY family transcriptional regulator, partial [Firmicutes bacterium]|nr:BlaI/MecI/CopY family transcriptional regulator [Candidatus Colimorpha enterica]
MEIQLGTIEMKFADMIWENEPVTSSRLVTLCADAFGWKKSTTYTVLSRLCGKGLFKNADGTVTSVVSYADYHSSQSRQFVDDSFGGSLPAFLAAFMNGRRITEEEAREIQEMIDRYREG